MIIPPEQMALGLASEPALDAGGPELSSAARGSRGTLGAEAGDRQGEVGHEDWAWEYAAGLESKGGPRRPNRGIDDGLGIDL